MHYFGVRVLLILNFPGRLGAPDLERLNGNTKKLGRCGQPRRPRLMSTHPQALDLRLAAYTPDGYCHTEAQQRVTQIEIYRYLT